jgi:N-acetylglucosaminyltransferase
LPYRRTDPWIRPRSTDHVVVGDLRLTPDPPLLPFLLLVCVLHLGLALVYALLQQRYAVRYARSRADDLDWGVEGSFLPSVDVVVPCFNEQPKLLDDCLTSLAKQDYQGQLKVFVVDDGSHNQDDIHPVMERHGQRSGWRLTLLDANVGKRRAMDAGLQLGDGVVVVVVDSASVLRSDAVSQIILPLADQRVGAVAASNRVLNTETWLPRLVNRSYWLLFELERAAQSHFRAVLCCNGALAAYRRTALESVWDRHVNQRFRGRECRSGDDMHLTLLLLTSGYDTILQPHARALTRVPDKLRPFFRQQLRWSRSFIRELPWAVRAIAGRSVYLAFDLAIQIATPCLKAIVVLLFLAEVVVLWPTWLDPDILDIGFALVEFGLVLATLLSTSTLGAIQARDVSYLLFGGVYLGLILPGWLHALVSPGHDTWSTRDLVPLPGGERRKPQEGGC